MLGDLYSSKPTSGLNKIKSASRTLFTAILFVSPKREQMKALLWLSQRCRGPGDLLSILHLIGTGGKSAEGWVFRVVSTMVRAQWGPGWVRIQGRAPPDLTRFYKLLTLAFPHGSHAEPAELLRPHRHPSQSDCVPSMVRGHTGGHHPLLEQQFSLAHPYSRVHMELSA